MPRATRKNRVYFGAHASVRLAGDDLDPSDVSRCLELPPDIAVRRGDPRMARSRSGAVQLYAPYRTGVWCLSSEKWVDSWRLATHVEWLIEQVQPKAAELAKLLAQGFAGDIFCYSSGRTQRPPPIPKLLRSRASALGLPIEIDHYDCSEHDAPAP